MSNQRSAVDPNFKPGRIKPASGNEGRLHPGMKHSGSYGPKPALSVPRPNFPGEAADYRRRQREYEARKAAGEFGRGMRDA